MNVNSDTYSVTEFSNITFKNGHLSVNNKTILETESEKEAIAVAQKLYEENSDNIYDVYKSSDVLVDQVIILKVNKRINSTVKLFGGRVWR